MVNCLYVPVMTSRESLRFFFFVFRVETWSVLGLTVLALTVRSRRWCQASVVQHVTVRDLSSFSLFCVCVCDLSDYFCLFLVHFGCFNICVSSCLSFFLSASLRLSSSRCYLCFFCPSGCVSDVFVCLVFLFCFSFLLPWFVSLVSLLSFFGLLCWFVSSMLILFVFHVSLVCLRCVSLVFLKEFFWFVFCLSGFFLYVFHALLYFIGFCSWRFYSLCIGLLCGLCLMFLWYKYQIFFSFFFSLMFLWFVYQTFVSVPVSVSFIIIEPISIISFVYRQ